MGRKDLQLLQDRFCDVTNLFVFCADAKGNQITELSGVRKEEAKLVASSVTKDRIESVFRRISEPGTLEEQIVEDTAYANVKLAAISNGIKGRTVCNWLIFAVLDELEEQEEAGERLEGITTVTTRAQLYRSMDLLRDTCQKIMQVKFATVTAEAESRRNKLTEQAMSKSLHRIETFTEIVQFLESDEGIEELLLKILELTGKFLQVSSCQIFRKQKNGERVDLLAQWCNQGIASVLDQTRGIERPGILYTDRPVVISSGANLTASEEEYMKVMHLKAVAVLPIQIGGAVSMYVSFCECREERHWQVDEIKFINDVVKIMQSIITKRIQKNSLASSYEALENILDNVGSAIYVKDEESGEFLFGNRILKKEFQKELKEGTLENLLQNNRKAGRNNSNYEVCHLERKRWYDLYCTTIHWVDGRKADLYAIYDITDKKIYQRKIEQQAYTDFLTGLYNRMCCERDLAWHIDQAKKDKTVGALLYLDLDDFKHINDGLGHQYGDVLLKAISHSLRRVDGIDNTCYRMGGDEFVIIIPPSSYDRFDMIINQIRDIFGKPWFLKDADYYCTMSMGVVNFPTEGENVQDLIKKADIAMYEAKKSGKNRMAQYSDNIMTGSNKRLDMEKNMRDATVDGYKEFEVYFQPIVDNRLPGSPCTGAEALIRWNSVEMGAISPSEFIPLAEYLGLINPIGNYVLRQACLACKKWNDSGHPNYKVNANLSVVQLLQPDIVEVIERTIEETGISPQNLTLEVTESLAINDMDRMKIILESIKKLGARIALDDFGTGYSSLNHIREMPLDVIKVDQSFVADLAQDKYSRYFIKMVAELADAIGVNVCVEGIETKEQYEVLKDMKVSLIQGFYFDRPMTKEAFEEKYVCVQEKTNAVKRAGTV